MEAILYPLGHLGLKSSKNLNVFDHVLLLVYFDTIICDYIVKFKNKFML